MKMVISFIFGIIVCSVILFGVRTVMPIRAETENQTGSDPLTQGLLDMLPDVEKIYRESLTLPFQKAEGKIYDEDIAEYYHELLDTTGLSAPPPEGN